MAVLNTGRPYNSGIDANNYPTLTAVSGTVGTADTAGTAEIIAIGGNPTTGALYVQDLSGATGTTTVQMVSGTLNVGTVVIPELSILIRDEEARRKQEINYTVMTEEEFSFRKKRVDPFITSIIYGSRVMLIGDEEHLLS